MTERRDKKDTGNVAELTLEVLKGLRVELKAGLDGLRSDVQSTNARLDQTNSRLDQTNARLDQTNSRLDETNTRLERLERRQTEGEIRVATELTAVSVAVGTLKDLLTQKLEVRKTRT